MEKVTVDNLEKFAAALAQLRLCVRRNLTPTNGTARRIVWMRGSQIYAEGYFIDGERSSLHSARWQAEGEWARDLARAAPAAHEVAPEEHFVATRWPNPTSR